MRYYFLLTTLTTVLGFQSLVYESMTNIKSFCNQYKIDASHNEIHSQEVLFYSKELMKDVPLDRRQKKLVILGSLFHDIIDSKYHCENRIETLINELSKVETDMSVITRTVLYINNISFSKTVKNCGEKLVYRIPNVVPLDEDFACFDIIRNADLLSSYNLKRAFQYRHALNPEMSTEALVNEVRDVYSRRMKKLRSSNVLTITYPHCDKLSNYMEKLCDKKLATYKPCSYEKTLSHFEIYPTQRLENILEEIK